MASTALHQFFSVLLLVAAAVQWQVELPELHSYRHMRKSLPHNHYALLSLAHLAPHALAALAFGRAYGTTWWARAWRPLYLLFLAYVLSEALWTAWLPYLAQAGGPFTSAKAMQSWRSTRGRDAHWLPPLRGGGPDEVIPDAASTVMGPLALLHLFHTVYVVVFVTYR
eukprot:CAMPEP_0198436706 /NCGR_PEP_ID=MMETSP1452-20131203/43767_1 /TAXON_ID=1181717 /ORGANISM="Synchroma pusillum, Strain CCMP3072" /LENGTH=167 /DNA_ID=CAMNT_0044157269 /DNA_START=1 /DNA_END=501 /DNA_ORIENTATION=+